MVVPVDTLRDQLTSAPLTEDNTGGTNHWRACRWIAGSSYELHSLTLQLKRHDTFPGDCVVRIHGNLGDRPATQLGPSVSFTATTVPITPTLITLSGFAAGIVSGAVHWITIDFATGTAGHYIGFFLSTVVPFAPGSTLFGSTGAVWFLEFSGFSAWLQTYGA